MFESLQLAVTNLTSPPVLAFVLGLIFLVFAASHRSSEALSKHSWLTPGGVPLVDWLLGWLVCWPVYVRWAGWWVRPIAGWRPCSP